MRDVAIVGVGLSRWGEVWDASLRTLWTEAALAALDDAGLDRVDSITVGSMTPGLFVGQEHLGALLADELGMAGVPATRVESACASGGVALKVGFAEVAAGLADIVLVTGVEKMTDVSGDECTAALAAAADAELEVFYGATFPGLYAMMARAHMARWGTTREQLAMVAVKNHRHGALNPHAQYRQEITVKDVIEAAKVAEPLTILDCSPITDGAAALVLAEIGVARKLAKGRPIVRVAGVGQATDRIALQSRADLTTLPATTLAAQRAFKMADKGPADVHLAEVHDCFTIAEIVVVEALGLCKPGEGGCQASSGRTALGGELPVNPSGGLKSKGHPVGATGVAQAVEITTQLRGAAGKRQVKGARVGLTQNMGGTGASTVVHILEVAS
ncbi:MAG: acetyl-CoA acetyltransferase [Acidobacteria bacterium RBG_13_68_16]|nr:MAG: acetyl-CoA acetyltransferase [Acidobacteria bacterium RBG_13_68_16]